MTSQEINGILMFMAIGVVIGIGVGILRQKRHGDPSIYVFLAAFYTALIFALYGFLAVMLGPSDVEGATLKDTFVRSAASGCYMGFIGAFWASIPAALTTFIYFLVSPKGGLK